MSVTETSNGIKKDSLSQDKDGNECWNCDTIELKAYHPKGLTHICYVIEYQDHADNVVPTSTFDKNITPKCIFV